MDASRSVAMQTIGFIGVGNIGIAISKHLIDAGHKVVGYRRAQAIILSNMNSHCDLASGCFGWKNFSRARNSRRNSCVGCSAPEVVRRALMGNLWRLVGRSIQA